MKTYLLVEIEHRKPLPAKQPITDVLSQRIYMYLYAAGVEASVKASLVNLPAAPGEDGYEFPSN